jgi:hypothetical protein
MFRERICRGLSLGECHTLGDTPIVIFFIGLRTRTSPSTRGNRDMIWVLAPREKRGVTGTQCWSL